jgi:hypothetical protein
MKNAITLIFIILLTISGCHPVRVISNRDPSYNSKINEVYLVLRLGKMDPDFEKEVSRTFISSFKANKIKCTVDMFNFLHLDTEEDLKTRIDANLKDVLINVKYHNHLEISSGTTPDFYQTVTTDYIPTYEVEMTAVGSKKVIWKASISGANYIDLSEHIVNKLIEDKFINPSNQ